MSYNITTWKTKGIKDLIIPKKAFFDIVKKDWSPKMEINMENKKVTMQCGCGQEIIGTIDSNDFIKIESFDMTGEGSGNFKYYCLDFALRKSTGYLLAVIVWEGGDSITQLEVKNGEVTESDYSL